MQQPNGKTIFVLSDYPNLTELYRFYCQHGTEVDSCRRLKRTLAENIISLQRVMQEYANTVEIGQKQSPSVDVVFDFGGQQCNGKRLSAAAYIDAIAAIIERIEPKCFLTLEMIAQTLLRAQHEATYANVS